MTSAATGAHGAGPENVYPGKAIQSPGEPGSVSTSTAAWKSLEEQLAEAHARRIEKELIWGANVEMESRV